MFRNTTIPKLLFISFLVLLGVSHAGSVCAGTNIWTSNGPGGGSIIALAIDPVTPTILYAGTYDGVFKSTDSGGRWIAVNTGLSLNKNAVTIAIDPVTPNTLYAGMWGDGVFKSANGGETWRAINAGLSENYVAALAIDPRNPSTLYAGTLSGIFKSTNSGETWVHVTIPCLTDDNVWDLAIDSRSTLYMATESGVYKSTDGENWCIAPPVLTNIGVLRLAIDPIQPDTIYAGTWGDGVFKSTDGGASWRAIGVGLPPHSLIYALAIDPVTPSTLYAGTYHSGAFKSTNGGESWNAINTGLNATYVGVLAINPQTPTILYAGTGSGGVFKSTDNGGNWHAANVGLPRPPIYELKVDPTKSSTVYAGTADGLFKSTDAGGNWIRITGGLPDNFVNALVFDPVTPTIHYAGLNDYGVYISLDSGASWRAANTDLTNSHVRDLVIAPTTPPALYAATGDGVFVSRDRGEHWHATDLTGSWVTSLAVDPVTPTTLYAGTHHGAFKSTDGGENWSATGLIGEWNVVRTLAIDPTMPTTLYAGVSYRGVYKSTDGGVTWSSTSSGLTHPDVYVLAIDPVSPATLYAGTDGGGVCKSTDGGENWSAFNDGLTDPQVWALAIDPIAVMTLYAGTRGGGVFKIQQVEYSCNNVSEIPQAECEALVSLYNSTDGLNWTRNDGWLVTNTPCSWYGVACEAEHVQGINLNSNQLSGAIPPELGDLAGLEELELGFHGRPLRPAPPWPYPPFCSGPQLSMSGGNQLSGPIPPEIGGLINLRVLALGGNRLNGAIPPNIGNLTKLTELNLRQNQLTGDIPALDRLANLEVLDLGDNQLESVPSLSSLTRLTTLFLDRNLLDHLPSLSNLVALGQLYLDHNNLTGGIPPELGSLTHLGELTLCQNQLSGSVPRGLGNLTGLVWLDLSYNQLSGAIPAELGRLANLWWLDLDHNQLSGAVPRELGNLSRLWELKLGHNPLSGSLPYNLMGLGLGRFHFSGTDLCEPPDNAFQAWLAGIPDLERTGVMCKHVSYLPLVQKPPAADMPAGVDAQGNFYRGNPNATVKLEAFMDFQCPFCARHALQTGPLLDQMYIATGEVIHVFRNLPLEGIHAHAVPAAKAAYCAGQQAPALFWSMHDWLFRNQSNWSQSADPSAQFRQAAMDAGADGPRYDACIADPATQAHIQRDRQEADARGVRGTPTFFVNSCVIMGALPFEAFQETIEKAKQGLCATASAPGWLAAGHEFLDTNPAHPASSMTTIRLEVPRMGGYCGWTRRS